MLEDLFAQNNSAKTNPNKQQLHQLPKIKTAILPECLNNLSYPSCDKQNHQTQPLSMVCIDQSCTNRTLICSLCQSSNHYQHLCIPLKIYLNEVFGHNYQTQPQSVPQQLPIIFEEQSPNTKKSKNKNNKNKNKNKQQQSKPTVKKNIQNNNSNNKHNQNNILYYLTKIQQQKKGLLRNLNINRENILEKFHILQTDITNYYNKMLQQVSMLIKMQNPVINIQKLVINIKAYHDKRYQQNSTEKQQQSNHILQKNQINKLKKYISNILQSTSLQQRYNSTSKMQIIFSQVSKVTQQIQKTLTNQHEKYIQQIDKLKQLINKQSNIIINNVIIKKSLDFKFSQKYKGHKFVLKNQNKIAQQTGMQSSGQRFILMQPTLSKVKKFQMKKTNIWGIKIVKISGWVGIGISLKNILIKANYHFNYTNIGHGSYLISNNGYSWSHSNKDFNSAYKSFPFAVGDIVYLEYNPMQKKLKFYKNWQTNTFQLDVIEPPENQEYCPSINMCSNGDSVEVINEKPGFL